MVRNLDLRGVNSYDDRALAACLSTHERAAFAVNLGSSAYPECGAPPFHATRVRIPLWRWPWTQWPQFESERFARDLQRLQRWYQARGHYDARVTAVEVRPEGTYPREPKDGYGEKGSTGKHQDCVGKGCKVRVSVQVEEGPFIRVTEIELRGTEGLPPSVVRRLRDAITLRLGRRFDEYEYDHSKALLLHRLEEQAYAHARVTGTVELHRKQGTAAVAFDVDPGPACTVGKIRVEVSEPQVNWVVGRGVLEKEPILLASLLREGEPFRRSALFDAQRGVFGLGVFSSVEVEPVVDTVNRNPVVNVVIRATPGRFHRYGLGAGVQSGTFEFLDGSTDPVPQWDLHLLALMEFRNFLGGYRQLRIEERPRAIFQNSSPLTNWSDPRPGNEVRIQFRQPSFLEPQTSLAFGARWDLGPNPYKGFFRHDLLAQLGPERAFFGGRLFAALRLRENVLVPLESGDDVPNRYHTMFLEQFLKVDLRDRPLDPRKGVFFSVGVHEAGFALPSSWNYLRVTPEWRGYVPLALGSVLAAKLAAGALVVLDADSNLDAQSAALGPERFRLRGGGSTSNRGYLPGELGQSVEGGIRRWEASLELRVPVTESLRGVLFVDGADVTTSNRFRWNYAHVSTGAGIRFQTPVGAVRFDVGYQVPGGAVIGGEDGPALSENTSRTEVNLGLVQFPGAMHLTIGEAF